MSSPAGEMPGFIRVGRQWTADVWWSAIRCRLGRFGAHSRVAPGLYALGAPDSDSPVLVTVSYRLSFDILRRDMKDSDCWILVLDTRGLGVGSAVASGLFGTDELVKGIASSRISRVVTHRTLVLPARAAGAVDLSLVARATGFEARHAPKGRAFGVLDAMALTPVELGRSLMWYPGFTFAALLYAGLGPEGVSLDRAFSGSWPLLLLGLASVVCGSLLAPVLYAFVPWIPLWVLGAALGCAGAASLLEGARLGAVMDPYLVAACWIFFPAAAAIRAVQFAKALPADVRPPVGGSALVLSLLAGGAAALVIAALVLSKLSQWRPGP